MSDARKRAVKRMVAETVKATQQTCPDCGERCKRFGGKQECPDDLAAARYEQAMYGDD